MFQNIKQFVSRLFHGSQLSVLSFSAYYHHKKLLIFPFVASALITAVFMCVFGSFFVFEQWFKAHMVWAVLCIFIFLFFVISFIDGLFKTMVVYAASDYAERGNTALFSTFTRAVHQVKKYYLVGTMCCVYKNGFRKKKWQ